MLTCHAQKTANLNVKRRRREKLLNYATVISFERSFVQYNPQKYMDVISALCDKFPSDKNLSRRLFS